MKTTILTTVGCSLLAFVSMGQMKQNGITPESFNTATPNQLNIQEHVAPRTAPARTSNTLINRAPCFDTLLFEDFQSQTIPASWINLDLDGATDANGRPQNWFPFVDFQTTTPGDTNYVAASSSWFTPAGVANNVLILDAVQPCAATVLRWTSAPFEGPIYMDGYEVRISTTGTNIADFTTTLFTVAESVNGTATPSSGTAHTSYNGNNGIQQQWEVSLGAYDNQTVYIAFFHDSNDDNLIMVDNIFIGLNIDYDVEITSVSTEPYYSTPLTQVTPRTFTSELFMATGTTATNVTSNMEVYQGVTSVFTDGQSVASLNAGNSVTFTTPSFTPSAIDMYTAAFAASANEADPNLSNNEDTLYFVVSDSVFATENGVITGALGIGAGATGFLGNQYDVVTTDELTSMTFTLTAPTVGDTVVGYIYDFSGATPNQIVGTTDTLFITSALQAEYTLPIVGGAVTLAPGSYVVGIQESVNSNITLATNIAYFNPGMAWVFFNGSWGNNEDFGFPNTYVMRANFGCPAVTADFTQTTNTLSVNFTDASTNMDAWMWDFGDGNTATQQNPNHTYAAAGTYTVCLIAASSCDADTLCTTVTVTNCANPTPSFTETVNTNGVVDFTSTSAVTGTATYAWDFGDGNTSTIENPTHTYAANGTYTVCLAIVDSCGTNVTCNDIVVNTIGLNENSLVDQLEIYPIPASGSMTIANLTSGEEVKIELLNNLGQVVRVIQSEGLETVEFDVTSIVDGYYHLRVSNANLAGTRAVLIKQ